MFNKEITIDNHLIGGEKTYIISEIGSNHNQDIEKAKKMIDVSIECGADAVKFQSIKPDELFNLNDLDKENIHLLESIQLKEEWYKELFEYCKKRNITYFSAPTYLNAIDLLLENEVKLMKIASPQTYGFPELIKKVGETGLPTIMSTGYCKYKEIERAVETFTKANNKNLILLHCISEYPTKIKNVNLNFINTLKNMFGTIVGFSDHTLGYEVSIAAVAKGAKVIEKHLTISRDETGPDHFFALEPNEFKNMIKSIRNIEKSFGLSTKQSLCDFEYGFRKNFETFILVNKDLKKGETIKKENLNYKRLTEKNDEISSWDEHLIINKTLNKDIKANTFIKLGDIE